MRRCLLRRLGYRRDHRHHRLVMEARRTSTRRDSRRRLVSKMYRCRLGSELDRLVDSCLLGSCHPLDSLRRDNNSKDRLDMQEGDGEGVW